MSIDFHTYLAKTLILDIFDHPDFEDIAHSPFISPFLDLPDYDILFTEDYDNYVTNRIHYFLLDAASDYFYTDEEMNGIGCS